MDGLASRRIINRRFVRFRTAISLEGRRSSSGNSSIAAQFRLWNSSQIGSNPVVVAHSCDGPTVGNTRRLVKRGKYWRFRVKGCEMVWPKPIGSGPS
jgi:hypothetical protein